MKSSLRTLSGTILMGAVLLLLASGCGNNSSNKTQAASADNCCQNTPETPMLKQTTPSPGNAATVQQFLKNAGNYYLATEEGGQPRVRPFGTAEIFEGKLYIQTGKSKNVYKQILSNPRVEICAFNGGEWIRIECELIPDDRVEAKKDMLDKNPSLRGMYDENDENTIVLYMRNATATISSFTAPSRTLEF